VVEDAECPDMLDLRPAGVDLVDDLTHGVAQVSPREQGVGRVGLPVLGCPPVQGSGVDRDQRGEEAAAVTDDDRFGDQGAGSQVRLDRLRGDVSVTIKSFFRPVMRR